MSCPYIVKVATVDVFWLVCGLFDVPFCLMPLVQIIGF